MPWAKDYITSSLVGLNAEGGTSAGGGGSVEVTSVASVTGDADINQRKGKLLTVYDLAITLVWKGKLIQGYHSFSLERVGNRKKRKEGKNQRYYERWKKNQVLTMLLYL